MYNTLFRGLSLSKIINGLSRTIGIANQIIPLYQKAKPMISNVKNIASLLNTSIKNNTTNINTNTTLNIEKKEENISPTFFL